jgi:hypothetical protein
MMFYHTSYIVLPSYHHTLTLYNIAIMSESTASQPAPSSAASTKPPPPPPPSSIEEDDCDDDDDDAPATIDLDAVPGQLGHAVLRSSDGSAAFGPPTGGMTELDASVVYRMMLEIGTVLEGGKEGGFRRVTVGFRNVTYVVALGGGDGCMYVVKRRSSP